MQIQVTLDKAAKKQGVSLYALAKKIGVKPNALTVTKRENYNPKLESLVLWSQALNCPITDLFEVKGKATFITAAKTALKKVAAAKPAAKVKAKAPAKKPTAKVTTKPKA